jgi:hypothetical protein
MHDLTRRLGIPEERFGNTPSLIQAPTLPQPDPLFDQAFSLASGPKNEDGTTVRPANSEEIDQAQIFLATAILAQSRVVEDERLIATLPLLARLVVHAKPEKLLGAAFAEQRDRYIPNGWRFATQSWTRFRYAWREGLVEILDPSPELQPIADSLDDATRLSPSEPEDDKKGQASPSDPTSNPLALGLTLLGLTLSVYGIFKTQEQTETIKKALKRTKKK